MTGLRIGWLGDLGGHLAMEPGMLAVCEQALQPHGRRRRDRRAVTSLGFDPERVWEAWLLWRRALSHPRSAP